MNFVFCCHAAFWYWQYLPQDTPRYTETRKRQNITRITASAVQRMQIHKGE